MTTPAGHSLLAFMAYFMASSMGRRTGLILLIIFMIATFLPDFDYFPILWGDFNLANTNHQGFSHSIFFAVLSSLALAIVAKWMGCGRALRIFPFILGISASHLLLDTLTYDGREPVGLMLLWPISENLFHSPIEVFGGFAKGNLSDVFSITNLGVIAGEFMILGPVTIVVWILALRSLKVREDHSE